MLYRQSGQGRQKGFHSLVLLLSGACLLLDSCVVGNREPSEAELSAFGEYVNSIDTLQLAHHLDSLLKTDSVSWEGDKIVKQRYADTVSYAGKSLWSSRMGVVSEADSVLSFLRREVPRHGLDSLAFYIPQIAEDLGIVRHLSFDSLGVSINEVLPRLDYYLSKAFVRYTSGQRYGYVRPDRLLNKMDFKRTGGYARLLDYEVKVPDYQESLQQLSSEGSVRMDYLRASQPSGHLYRVLQEQFEKTTDKEARHRLAVNMERCRWQMKQPEGNGRMVLVNIPALQLWAIGGDSVLDMRIVCGAKGSKTPLLHSEIRYMQVNPEWLIPKNIIDTEVAHHGGDSAYFAKRRYYIVDRSSGDTLHPATVRPDQLKSGRLRVGQKGGVGNSLGRIVFRFPNDFDVYLHDTSNRGAFNSDHRTLSHGCVRVQKPFDLACFLLPDADEWFKDRLRISMDISPVTDRGRQYLKAHANDPRPLRAVTYQQVSPHVPVFIIYFTTYPNPKTGVVETWPDLYGYDKVISEAGAPFLF